MGGGYNQMQGTTGASNYGMASSKGFGQNTQSTSFLNRKPSQGPGDADVNDLKQKIAALELENKQLKEKSDKDLSIKQ